MKIPTKNLSELKIKYGSLAAAAKMAMANRPFPVNGDEIPQGEEPKPAKEEPKNELVTVGWKILYDQIATDVEKYLVPLKDIEFIAPMDCEISWAKGYPELKVVPPKQFVITFETKWICSY